MTDLDPAIEVLEAWGVVPSGPVEAMQPEGTFRIPTEGGDLILTRSDPLDARTAEQVRLKHDVLQHLSRAGVPVAVPLPDRQGRIAVPQDGHTYTLSPRLPGQQGTSKPVDCDTLYRNYGVSIARMHRALATFPMEVIAGRAQREILVSRVFDDEIPRLTGNLTGTQAVRFCAMVDGIGEDMRAALEDLPEQLIHRDCHAGNLLSCGDEVTGIIDWDLLRVGARAFDLAYFCAELAKRHVGDPDTMAQWLHDIVLVLHSYDNVNRLSDSEKTAFPYVVVAELIIFTGWVVETAWTVMLQTELAAMAWMYSNLSVIEERLAVVWKGDPG